MKSGTAGDKPSVLQGLWAAASAALTSEIALVTITVTIGERGEEKSCHDVPPESDHGQRPRQQRDVEKHEGTISRKDSASPAGMCRRCTC